MENSKNTEPRKQSGVSNIEGAKYITLKSSIPIGVKNDE